MKRHGLIDSSNVFACTCIFFIGGSRLFACVCIFMVGHSGFLGEDAETQWSASV